MRDQMPRKAKKVIFVIPCMGGGGAERVLSIILEHLDRDRVTPMCIFYTSRHVYNIPDDVGTYCIDSPGSGSLLMKIYYSVMRVFQIKRIIDLEKPDVIFSFFDTVNIALIITHKFLRRDYKRPRLIISERSTPSIDTRRKKRFHGVITRWLMSRLYTYSDDIIVNSEGVRDDLISNFNLPERSIMVINNPLDTRKMEALSRETVIEHKWFNEDLPVIISIGSLISLKAHDSLLKAFKLVSEKIECRLVILGEGDKEAELKALSVKLGISDKVAFLGFQENPFKFLANSSLFVLSSRWEGFPNVLIEAMACGIPVVSTRCKSGPEEIITDQENGLLVPVGDEAALAEAVTKMISHPDEAARMALRAKEAVRRFEVSAVIKEYERLLCS